MVSATHPENRYQTDEVIPMAISMQQHMLGIFAPVLIIPLILGTARKGSLPDVQFTALLGGIICIAILWISRGYLIKKIPGLMIDYTDPGQIEAYLPLIEVDLSAYSPLIYIGLLGLLIFARYVLR